MNAPPPFDGPDAPDAPPGRGTALSGDRLRWGVTGLAAVLLIVMAAAAVLRPTGREPQPGTCEPLAVLGVAPGPATRPGAPGVPGMPAAPGAPGAPVIEP